MTAHQVQSISQRTQRLRFGQEPAAPRDSREALAQLRVTERYDDHQNAFQVDWPPLRAGRQRVASFQHIHSLLRSSGKPLAHLLRRRSQSVQAGCDIEAHTELSGRTKPSFLQELSVFT